MRKVLLAAALALGALFSASVVFWLTAEDPAYSLAEVLSLGGYRQYDDLIRKASARYGLPPELIKAVIWRESKFHPRKIGSQGERGLMQIMESAAADWARVEKVSSFQPGDLFDPDTNIEAGTWYLKRAMTHWGSKDDPVPFALAEYNAGRTRVKRWVQNSGRGETATAIDLQGAMSYPGTKSYVASIMARAAYYKKRGDFRTD